MCENCFENEIVFRDLDHWRDFDLELTKKLGAGKLLSIEFQGDGKFDKDDGLYIYQCTACNEKWKLRDPINNQGGWFLRFSSKELVRQKGCLTLIIIFIAITQIL